MKSALLFLLVALIAVPSGRAAGPFPLSPGDRLVLLGGTLIEREQRYGRWETLLTTRAPGVTFRNLGWSGDTVLGEARASFDFPNPDVPFRRLVQGTLSLKPTVLFVAYGTNESFAGPAGLSKFLSGMEKLLDALAPAKARIVLIAPPRFEDLGRPLPDPTAQNRNLRLYGDTLRAVAQKRGLSFVDLFSLPDEAGGKTPLTDNGMHLTDDGYKRSAAVLERALGWEPARWRVEVDAATVPSVRVAADGARVEAPVTFQLTDAALPTGTPRLLLVKGLAEGKWALDVDGVPVATAAAAAWAGGVALTIGPEFDQAEKLRLKIVEKNREYFHRWRPQNETYLFGFRKHEQGQNAREVPLFEPLVEKLEQEIAQLRQPAPRLYRLRPTK